MSTSEMVSYQGRMVPKEGFRAYIYGTTGEAKLVNSYLEYEEHIQTGAWFTSTERLLEHEKFLVKDVEPDAIEEMGALDLTPKLPEPNVVPLEPQFLKKPKR